MKCKKHKKDDCPNCMKKEETLASKFLSEIEEKKGDVLFTSPHKTKYSKEQLEDLEDEIMFIQNTFYKKQGKGWHIESAKPHRAIEMRLKKHALKHKLYMEVTDGGVKKIPGSLSNSHILKVKF